MSTLRSIERGVILNESKRMYARKNRGDYASGKWFPALWRSYRKQKEKQEAKEE